MNTSELIHPPVSDPALSSLSADGLSREQEAYRLAIEAVLAIGRNPYEGGTLSEITKGRIEHYANLLALGLNTDD